MSKITDTDGFRKTFLIDLLFTAMVIMALLETVELIPAVIIGLINNEWPHWTWWFTGRIADKLIQLS